MPLTFSLELIVYWNFQMRYYTTVTLKGLQSCGSSNFECFNFLGSIQTLSFYGLQNLRTYYFAAPLDSGTCSSSFEKSNIWFNFNLEVNGKKANLGYFRCSWNVQFTTYRGHCCTRSCHHCKEFLVGWYVVFQALKQNYWFVKQKFFKE